MDGRVSRARAQLPRDALVQLLANLRLQCGAYGGVTQWFPGAVGNKEDIFDPLAQGGNLGTLQQNIELQKNSPDTGEQSRPGRTEHLQNCDAPDEYGATYGREGRSGV